MESEQLYMSGGIVYSCPPAKYHLTKQIGLSKFCFTVLEHSLLFKDSVDHCKPSFIFAKMLFFLTLRASALYTSHL